MALAKPQSKKINKSIPPPGIQGFLSTPAGYSLLALLFLTILVYARMFTHEFTNWDDPEYVTSNAVLVRGAFADFWTEIVASNYHPFTLLSLKLDYILWGRKPAAFLGMNLVLHLGNIIAVWYLFRQLTTNNSIAWMIAALFAVHPLHVESVAWVSERKDVLYTFFLLISANLYIRQIQSSKFISTDYLLAVLFFVFACLSKAMAVVLPGMLLVFQIWKTGKFQLHFLYKLIPFGIISLVFGIVAIKTQAASGALGLNPDKMVLTFFDRFMVMLYGNAFYLWKMLIPYPLSAFYPYPVNFTLYYPILFWILSLLTVVLIPIVYIIGKKHAVVWAAAILYFWILLPVSQILPVGNAISADRYFYLACLGPFWIFAYFWDKWKTSSPRSELINWIPIIIFAAFAFQRVQVWKNSIVLFENVIEHYPEAAVAYHGLGEAYNAKKDYNKAKTIFEAGLKWRPDYVEVLYNLAVVYDKLGEPVKSVPLYIQALTKNPKYTRASYNLGNSYYQLKMPDSALYWFNNAISIEPTHIGALNNMANIYFDSGALPEAKKILLRVIEINPNQEESLFNLGSIDLQQGNPAQALVYFKKCVELNPELSDNYRMAGMAAEAAGLGAEAVPYFTAGAQKGDAYSSSRLNAIKGASANP